MSAPTSKPKLWFLTGSQHLYGDETLRQVAAQSRAGRSSCSTASGRIPAEIVWQTGAHRRRRRSAG